MYTQPKPKPKPRPRWPWDASTARRAASDIVEHVAAEVEREYSLVSTWDLVSQCWPRERRSVMREVIYRRMSWW